MTSGHHRHTYTPHAPMVEMMRSRRSEQKVPWDTALMSNRLEEVVCLCRAAAIASARLPPYDASRVPWYGWIPSMELFVELRPLVMATEGELSAPPVVLPPAMVTDYPTLAGVDAVFRCGTAGYAHPASTTGAGGAGQ